jgi:hypothetical protein
MSRNRTSGIAASIAILVPSALALCVMAGPALGKSLTAKQIANKVLKLDPRKPSKINLFTSTFANAGQGFYPQGSAMHPASGPDLTEAQARSKLKGYLQAQFPGDSGEVNAALAQFDSQKAKSLIADPTLRAAYVGMRGTLLDPTINYGLNSGKFILMAYNPLPDSAKIAGTTGGDGSRAVFVNDRYIREDFRYLIGVMGHEVLHDDFSTSPAEEAINNTLSAMTYVQVLSRHPELAYKGTELSRQMNDLALAFLNSHEHGSPNSEVYAPTGKGITPGGPHNVPDIWTLLHGDSATSLAPTPLGQIMRSLGLPGASKFSLATAKTFANLNDNWLSDVGRVQVEVLLQMLSVKTIADKANLSRSKVISKLHLRPYLDAIK